MKVTVQYAIQIARRRIAAVYVVATIAILRHEIAFLGTGPHGPTMLFSGMCGRWVSAQLLFLTVSENCIRKDWAEAVLVNGFSVPTTWGEGLGEEDA